MDTFADVADGPGELMGTQEIQNLLNVSRTRARQITRERTFPEPYQRLAAGSIWLRKDVEAWIKEHRRPRPAATDEDEQA